MRNSATDLQGCKSEAEFDEACKSAAEYGIMGAFSGVEDRGSARIETGTVDTLHSTRLELRR